MATSNEDLYIPQWMQDELLRALYHTHTLACRMVQVGLAEAEESLQPPPLSEVNADE